MRQPSPEEIGVTIRAMHDLLADCQAREAMANAWIKALIPAIDTVLDVFDPGDDNISMVQYNALVALSKARHDGALPEREKENGDTRSN